MSNNTFSLEDWIFLKEVSKDYIDLVNRLVRIRGIHGYVTNFNIHIHNSSKLHKLLGENSVEKPSTEVSIKNILINGPKTLPEIKASFNDLSIFEIKEVLLNMEENQEIDFHSATGLWMVI